MGSCISKCRPKRKKFKPHCSEEDFSHVHNKLVISHAPVSPAPLLIRQPVSPSPSAASSTSLSSFSGATTSASSGFSVASLFSSSSSSSSSSVSISKDRSFSNEFLWSCAKENPHVIGRNLIRGKVHPQVLESPSREIRPVVLPIKQAIPERPGGSTPKKRARENSPTLVRQKSFRKEPDRVSSTNHLPNGTLRSPSPSRVLNADGSFNESLTSRALRSPSPARGQNADQSFRDSLTSGPLRSPSPSRRFNGDQSFRDSYTSTMKEIHSKRSAVSKASLINYSSSSLRKESFRSPSANFDSKDRNVPFKINRDAFCHQIGSKIDENAVEEEKKDNNGVEAMIIEDFNNPLIALDCFIFL